MSIVVANTQAEQDELVRIWDAQEAELAALGKRVRDLGHIGQYLDDDVLSIERVQYLNHQVEAGKIRTHAVWKENPWATSRYILTTATGGPHVEFDTDHRISVYWAGGHQESVTSDPNAIKAMNKIAEYLDELYS